MSLNPLCQPRGLTHIHAHSEKKKEKRKAQLFNWALRENSETIHPTIHYAFNR